MRYAFIKGHHLQFSVRRMCNMLCVHPSGFYAWLKRPFSKRALEDKRQAGLLKKAWEESGKVYGYRKLHDDLQDQGETCCPNRVARLTRMAGIKAQIGYRRRSGTYGGKPSIAISNTLDRQFDVTMPDTAWVTDITYIKTTEGSEREDKALQLFNDNNFVMGRLVALQAILLSSLISTPAVLWAGQCKAGRRLILSCKHCLWRYGAGSPEGKS
jgi:putative transposase